MAEVATAYVTLLPSARGFARGIEGQIGGGLRTAGQRGGESYAGGMKAGVAGMATKVFAPLAIAAGALGLGKILSDSITAGSDLQQSLGGVSAVFKKQADVINESATRAAESLGLSRNAYLEMATVLGATLKNKGVKDFTKQTQTLIQAGADLAAQFGGTTEDAVNALASAMRGEMDPIERYGVSLNEAALKAEALRLGLTKGSKPLDIQTKALTVLSLVQKQSADAMGAFARESDTYANKQQRLAASWDNIKSQVGTALLPALTRLSDWFLTKGLPAIKEFGGWLTDHLWPALKKGWETVRPGLEEAKSIIMGAFGGDSGQTLKDFGAILTDQIIPVVAQLVRVWLPALALQYRGLLEVIKVVVVAFQTWATVVRTVAAVILDEFIKVTEFGAKMLDALSRVPGFGWAKDAANKLRSVADTARDVKNAINSIPTQRRIQIIATVKLPGRIRLPGGELVNVGLRAKGGPVKAGSPYVVGEKGPELIVPSKNGHVIPNHEAFASQAAAGSGQPLDYWRLGDVLAAQMSRARLEVGVAPVTRAVNQRNAARAAL